MDGIEENDPTKVIFVDVPIIEENISTEFHKDHNYTAPLNDKCGKNEQVESLPENGSLTENIQLCTYLP